MIHDDSELSDFVVGDLEKKPQSIQDYFVRMATHNYESLDEIEEDLVALRDEHHVERHTSKFWKFMYNAEVIVKMSACVGLAMGVTQSYWVAGVVAIGAIFYGRKAIPKMQITERAANIYPLYWEGLADARSLNMSESAKVHHMQAFMSRKLGKKFDWWKLGE